MDLGTIKMHIDNFVDTWQGWGKIISGLTQWEGSSKAYFDFVNIGSWLANVAPALSSN